MARTAARQSKSRSTSTARTSRAETVEKGITYGQLRRYNFLASLLFLVQGVLVLLLSDPIKGVQSITTAFLADDKAASAAEGHQLLVAASHHLFDLNIVHLLAAFFFVSALAHFIIATWKRKVYERDLNKGANRARWIEYSIYASIMMVAIAILAGVLDFTSLIMIFALTAIMSLLGMAMELRNKGVRNVDWANYSIGVVAGAVPWLVIFTYIWNAHVYGNGVPSYVYWICGSLFVLAASSAINMYLQYKKLGHWSTYIYGERAYIVLSFVAKTALAWQVFAGTLR
jgi:hypothetical protein